MANESQRLWKILNERLTATRAGYLDELDFDLDARLGAPAGASLAADLATIDGVVDTINGHITADYGAAQKGAIDDLIDGGRLDLLIDGIKAVTDALPDAGALNDLATILGLVDSAESAGNYSYTNVGGEQDVYEDTATTRRRIWVCVSNRNMTQTGTFRIYRKVDGTNYDLYIAQAVTVGAGDERAFDAEFTTSLPWKITYQEDVDEGADRNIPYEVIIMGIE